MTTEPAADVPAFLREPMVNKAPFCVDVTPYSTSSRYRNFTDDSLSLLYCLLQHLSREVECATLRRAYRRRHGCAAVNQAADMTTDGNFQATHTDWSTMRDHAPSTKDTMSSRDTDSISDAEENSDSETDNHTHNGTLLPMDCLTEVEQRDVSAYIADPLLTRLYTSYHHFTYTREWFALLSPHEFPCAEEAGRVHVVLTAEPPVLLAGMLHDPASGRYLFGGTPFREEARVLRVLDTPARRTVDRELHMGESGLPSDRHDSSRNSSLPIDHECRTNSSIECTSATLMDKDADMHAKSNHRHSALHSTHGQTSPPSRALDDGAIACAYDASHGAPPRRFVPLTTAHTQPHASCVRETARRQSARGYRKLLLREYFTTCPKRSGSYVVQTFSILPECGAVEYDARSKHELLSAAMTCSLLDGASAGAVTRVFELMPGSDSLSVHSPMHRNAPEKQLEQHVVADVSEPVATFMTELVPQTDTDATKQDANCVSSAPSPVAPTTAAEPAHGAHLTQPAHTPRRHVAEKDIDGQDGAGTRGDQGERDAGQASCTDTATRMHAPRRAWDDDDDDDDDDSARRVRALDAGGVRLRRRMWAAQPHPTNTARGDGDNTSLPDRTHSHAHNNNKSNNSYVRHMKDSTHTSREDDMYHTDTNNTGTTPKEGMLLGREGFSTGVHAPLDRDAEVKRTAMASSTSSHTWHHSPTRAGNARHGSDGITTAPSHPCQPLCWQPWSHLSHTSSVGAPAGSFAHSKGRNYDSPTARKAFFEHWSYEHDAQHVHEPANVVRRFLVRLTRHDAVLSQLRLRLLAVYRIQRFLRTRLDGKRRAVRRMLTVWTALELGSRAQLQQYKPPPSSVEREELVAGSLLQRFVVTTESYKMNLIHTLWQERRARYLARLSAMRLDAQLRQRGASSHSHEHGPCRRERNGGCTGASGMSIAEVVLTHVAHDREKQLSCESLAQVMQRCSERVDAIRSSARDATSSCAGVFSHNARPDDDAEHEGQDGPAAHKLFTRAEAVHLAEVNERHRCTGWFIDPAELLYESQSRLLNSLQTSVLTLEQQQQ